MFDRIKRAWTELVRPVRPNVKALSNASGTAPPVPANFYGSWGLVDGSRPDPTRPYEPLQSWDFSRSVTPWDYLQILSQSRKLFANLGPIRSAVLQSVCDLILIPVNPDSYAVLHPQDFGVRIQKES